ASTLQRPRPCAALAVRIAEHGVSRYRCARPGVASGQADFALRRFALDIKGKAAVVTGSSSDEGIGAACARLLAARGCNVIVNYAPDKTGGEAIAAECRDKGVDSIAVQADVSKDEDCKRLVAAAVERFGRLDALVNNAAITKPIPHKRMDLLDGEE